MGQPAHHHLVCLEGPLVADSCLGDHDPRAMALVSLPHANVALAPGRTRGWPEWGQDRCRAPSVCPAGTEQIRSSDIA